VDAHEPEPIERRALVEASPASEGRNRGVVGGVHGKPKNGRGVEGCENGVVVVHLQARVKPGKQFDGHDNLRAGMKALVDAIAETLGVPDKHHGIRWEYSQAETIGQCGVVVTIGLKN
jgi:hypothetical protein